MMSRTLTYAATSLTSTSPIAMVLARLAMETNVMPEEAFDDSPLPSPPLTSPGKEEESSAWCDAVTAPSKSSPLASMDDNANCSPLDVLRLG